MSTRLLIISHDVVGARMAGPGIRAYHLARVLARHTPTTLAVPNAAEPALSEHGFAVIPYTRGDWSTLAAQVAAADVCLVACDTLNDFPQLAELDLCLVIDGYDPLLAEWLALHPHLTPAELAPHWRERMVQLTRQYLCGDFYLCASERQRDWWLGLLEASGRINPHTHHADPSLRSLIDLVPYGLDGAPPRRTQPVIKGVWEGIGADDKVILWGGGLWPWLDPFTAIRAVGEIQRARRDVRLVFPGTKHPNPVMATMQTHTPAAMALADELGLLNRAVFFGEWIPYSSWDDVLLDSDVALTLHHDTLETRLAFRSRIFEYIRAGLPIVATEGDATSELVTRFAVGRAVGYGAVGEVAAAILALLAAPTGEQAAAFAHARSQLTWARAAEPLVSFCQNPRRAPDRTGASASGNPFYAPPSPADQAERASLLAQIDQQAALIAAYERGLFMRAMRAVAGVRRRLFRG